MEESGSPMKIVTVTYVGDLEVNPQYPGEVVDTAAELEVAFDATMRELIRLGFLDATVDGSLATGHVEVSVSIETDDPDGVLRQAAAALRAALHAADISTEDWPMVYDVGPPDGGPTARRTMRFEKYEIQPA